MAATSKAAETATTIQPVTIKVTKKASGIAICANLNLKVLKLTSADHVA
jgi:hypothetical protein